MKSNKTLRKAILFGVLIFLAGLIGQPTAHGYLHPADPLVLLAAVVLPFPYAAAAAGGAGILADLVRGYYLLSPCTLIIRVLMVLAVKGLLKTRPAEKYPELMASAAAFIPVAGYYLSELIYQLCIGGGLSAFSVAAVTLRKDLIQAAASVLLFVFLYDIYKGVQAGRETLRRKKAAEAAAGEEKQHEQNS